MLGGGMIRVAKKKIEIKLIYDTREKNPLKIKLDKDFKSDKIKICEVQTKCFKALGCKTSTGDIGIEYKLDENSRWKKTKLSIELKRNSDIFSTLYSSIKRFNRELKRVDDYGLDFYILHNWSFDDIKAHIVKLQNMRKLGYNTQPFIVFLNNYLQIAQKYAIICCGNNFEMIVRRIIKNYIIKNKLQY